MVDYLRSGIGFGILVAVLVLILAATVLVVRRSSYREYTGRIALPVFFFEFACLFGFLALGFPDKGDEVGPGVVPMLWIVGIILLSVFLFIRSIMNLEEKDPPWGQWRKVAVFIAMTILYLIIMQYIGYYVSTVLFLSLGMIYLGYRNWKVVVPVSAGWILFSYFMFYRLLFVPLPRGILIDLIFG